MKMTKKERMQAAVSGRKPDRIPFGMWSHMPHVDHDAEANTEETWAFYRKYDLDFIKTMNNGMYSIEDYGCEIDYSEVPKGGVAKLVSTPVHTAQDWALLEEPSLYEGAIGRELRYLEMILDRARQEDVPVIFTVFSPITTANKLCGGNVASYIHAGDGDKVRAALENIAGTTSALAAEAIHMGAAGVFLAAQMSIYAASEMASEVLTEEEYAVYGKPYDAQVFDGAKQAGAWMNTLHCHGQDIMFDVLRDYPCDIFNYHVWETLPSLEEALCLTGKCVMGGLKRFDITNGRRNEIRNQIFECCRVSGGKNLILTPGCVIRYPLNESMLRYVRETKDLVERALGLAE